MSSTSTSTSISTSAATTANTTSTLSTATTFPKYQDLWTFNFAVENLIQHRIRLVKVNGHSFIAFSKFYFNQFSNTYQPTQKQYFIPQHRWAQLQKGLIELSNFLTTVNNGEAATAPRSASASASAESGGFIPTTSNSHTTGTRPLRIHIPTVAVSIHTPPTTPPSIPVNINPFTFGFPRATSICSTNNSTSTSGFPQLSIVPKDATKRGRGRPPKESTLAKRNKPIVVEGERNGKGKGEGEGPWTGWLTKESTIRSPSASPATAAAIAHLGEKLEQEEYEERIEAAIACAAADPNLE